MKEFRKTLFAKTFYYLMTVFSFIVFVGSIILEVAMGYMGFYEFTYETLQQYYISSYNHYVLSVYDMAIINNYVAIAYDMRFWIYAVTVVSFILLVVFLVKLLKATGRQPMSDEIHTNLLDKIPTDIYAVIVFTFYSICAAILCELLIYVYWPELSMLDVMLIVITLCIAVLLAPIFLMGFAIRVKNGSFWKNTVIYWILKKCWQALKWTGKYVSIFWHFNVEVFRSIPMIWRTALICAVVTFVEFLVIIIGWYEMDVVAILWFMEKLIVIPAVIFAALTLRKLQKAGEALAEGDLSYRLDTKGLFWDLKKHGDNLNSISKGMAQAVDKKIKSELMKTELITNVSHDIKTPITSIINYATLISEEPTDNENIKEYTEVLIRQSERLKRLTEDLVEASKASTGNIDVDLVPCDPSIFITQADGEYEEKLSKSDLTLITRLPEEEVTIMADGRRMWRVFDNLMNNICKYALPGTRVYLSLDIKDNDAVFTFKNTSRDQLDISEEELMERFVRGDKSRNTEGNGLGLSIAKSMAEVQGGKLDISIDGDLFKAVAIFPVVMN